MKKIALLSRLHGGEPVLCPSGSNPILLSRLHGGERWNCCNLLSRGLLSRLHGGELSKKDR